LGEGTHHVSLDGHNLPRHTHLVDLDKGKMGNPRRILKEEQLVLAYDLDMHTCQRGEVTKAPRN
jgi:hypothetical protein